LFIIEKRKKSRKLKMREDIFAGLKNAVERGESVEKAMNAFINAGYNQEEVKEAAESLGFSYTQKGQTPQSNLPVQPIKSEKINENIVAGLKNAVERGESVEKAMEVFINSGYNRDKVKEAAESLGFSYTQQKPQFRPLPKSPNLTKKIQIPGAPSPVQETSTAISNPSPAQNNSEKPEPSRKLKTFNIILGVIIFILLVIIGISAWNFLKGQWVLG